MFSKSFDASRACRTISSETSRPTTWPNPSGPSPTNRASRRVAHPEPQPRSSTRSPGRRFISRNVFSVMSRWWFSIFGPSPAAAQRLNSCCSFSSGVCGLSGIVISLAYFLRADRFLGPLVDLQLEDVRARIVTHDVEIVLPTHDLRAINLCGQDRFALPVGASEKIPERIDDATPTARHDGIWVVCKG